MNTVYTTGDTPVLNTSQVHVATANPTPPRVRPGDAGGPLHQRTPEQFQTDAMLALNQMLANVAYGRREIAKMMTDPRRDIHGECGHPDPADLTSDYFWTVYERSAIGGRVVEVLAKESWQVTPEVTESEKSAEATAFEQDWDGVARYLRGEVSYFKDEAGNTVWEYLRRADEMCGIGHFGCLLLGFDDTRPGGRQLKDPVEEVLASTIMSPEMMGGGDMSTIVPGDIDSDLLAPVDGVPGAVESPELDGAVADPSANPTRGEGGYGKQFLPAGGTPTQDGKRRLIFIRVFPENLVQIVRYDHDINSPRYGKPLEYLITFNDPRMQHTGVGLQTGTKHVHWTRVIHITDRYHQSSSSEVLSPPRLKPVLNHVLDADKLYGASAEMYWRGAFPGISFETHPQMGGDVAVNVQRLKDMYEQYVNHMDRGLYTAGMQAKMLAPSVVDPTPQINAHLDAICIKLGIPMRIFKGSERGELASTQDDAAWNDRLKARQETFITPHIIVPFIDRLITAGVLTRPATGFKVKWPDLTSKSDQEKATVALTLTQALVAFVNGNGESAMTLMDFFTRFLGLSEEVASGIMQGLLDQAGKEFSEPAKTLPKEVEPGDDPAEVPELPPGESGTDAGPGAALPVA